MSGTRRSLFWTVAGMFLLTLILGSLVQVIVAVAVLRPLESREARARAELAVGGAAADLAAAGPAASPRSLLERHRHALGPRSGWLVYRDRDGGLVTDPPGRERFVAPLFGGPEPPAREREGPRPRLEVIARHAVQRGSESLGEVLLVRPERPRGMRTPDAPTSLLFLPIAMLASLVAGLVMVRLLVRRLRALEQLAARVAAGDLTVRIADTSGDEIGRLAERLDGMTERLAAARDRLEATERQRRQLFADITHELATPLTSIRGYAETLLDASVTVSQEERTRYVHGVLDESSRLDRLIRDLFELARLEAGASPLVKERLDWAAMCRNTIQRFEGRFRDAGLGLVWSGTAEEAWIEADGHRLEEVLDNLLVNALRYVPSGGTVELGLESLDAGDRYRLTVRDDGPGIADEELPLVFERFFRAAGAREHAGSGLGLAIVREIVTRHGGTVRAERREPHGLAMIVELPARG